MKKICASALSANGMLRSNTRRSEIGADPTIGASTHAAAATAPKTTTVRRTRRRSDTVKPPAGAAQRHHRQVAGALVEVDVGLDVVERPHRSRA